MMNKNNLDKQYLQIVNDVIENGFTSKDRTGTGTIKKFGYFLKHKMSEGFPLLTSKQVFTKGVILELLWFLSGETNIKPLVDNGVYIWVGDCYKNYLKLNENKEALTKEEFINKIKNNSIDCDFNKKYASIGKGYGKQWRDFSGIDQISNAINELNTNPDNRRILVNAWNVGELNEMLLVPCHYSFQLWTRELTNKERWEIVQNEEGGMFSKKFLSVTPEHKSIKESLEYTLSLEQYNDIPKYELSLLWNQRSSDSLLGKPFNIASYGFLLEMIAQQVNMKTGELNGCFGDTHVYLNQKEIYLNEQKDAETFALPKLKLNKAKDIFSYKLEDFKILNYQFYKKINYPLSN